MLFLLLLFSCGQTEEKQTKEVKQNISNTNLQKETISFDSFQIQQIVWDPKRYYTSLEEVKKPKDALVSIDEFSDETLWYRYKSNPRLTPFNNEDPETTRFFLEEEKDHPLAFGWTPANKKEIDEGVFTNDSAIQIFAVSSSTDEDGIKVLIDEAIKAEQLYPYLLGSQFIFPHKRFRNELPKAKLPSLKKSLSLHVICWGGYDKDEWPAPPRSKTVTGESKTWGPDLSKQNTPKDKRIQAKHPRKDLKNNRCELFLSDIGAEWIQGEDKSDLKKKKFFLLAELTEKGITNGVRALEPNLVDMQEDFRVTGLVPKEDEYAWKLHIESVINTIMGVEKTPEVEEQQDSGQRNEEDDDLFDDDLFEDDDDTGSVDTQEECDCPEVEKVAVQSFSMSPCSSLAKTDTRYTRYQNTVERTKEWIALLKIPLKWKKSGATGFFTIQKVDNTIEDCTQMKVIMMAFKDTAGCLPDMQKSSYCWSDIRSFVEERK